MAAFPIFWISVMSVKLPLDAFNSNPLNVIFGMETLSKGKGLSLIDITVGLSIILFTAKLTTGWLGRMVNKYSPNGYLGFGWIIGAMAFGLSFIIIFFTRAAQGRG
jgi:multiple sugar transport system permease protein